LEDFAERREIVPPPGLVQPPSRSQQNPFERRNEDPLEVREIIKMIDEDDEQDNSLSVASSYINFNPQEHSMPRPPDPFMQYSQSDRSENQRAMGQDSSVSVYLDWLKNIFNIKWEITIDKLEPSKIPLELNLLQKPPVLASDSFVQVIHKLLNKNRFKVEFLLIKKQYDQFWLYRLTLKTSHPHSGREEVVGYREIEVSAEDLEQEMNHQERIAFFVGLSGVFPDLDNLIACHQIRIVIGLDKGFKPILFNESDSSLSSKRGESSTQGKSSQNTPSNQNLNFQKSSSNSQNITNDSLCWERIPEKSINQFFMDRPHLISEGQIKEVFFNSVVISKFKFSTENYRVKLGKKLEQFYSLARSSIQSKDFASLFNLFAMIYNAQPAINENDPTNALVLISETPILKVVNECKNKKIRKNLVFLTAVRFLWEDFFRDEIN
jgi:hypothetical protein